MSRSRSAEATVKGFNYQFDATIIKILSSSGDVTIEGIEDIDLCDEKGLEEYIQCKYYEGTKLTNSVFRKIITPMLEDYKSNGKKTYTIYGHFNEKNIVDLKSDKLKDFKDDILKFKKEEESHDLFKELSLTDDDLKEFISCLKIIETSDYNTHKEEVKFALSKALSCSRDEVNGLFYSNSFSLIAEIATKGDISERVINRKDFLKKINTKEQLYSTWLLVEQGQEKFCQEMRSKHFSSVNISPFARFFIIHCNEFSSKENLKELVLEISRKWGNSTKTRVEDNDRFAPYIFLEGYPKADLIELKNELYQENHLFVDGYPYKGAVFSLKNLSYSGNKINRIEFRIIHSGKDLEETLLNLVGKTKEVYEFYKGKYTEISHQSKHVKIPINSIKMIKDII